MQTDFTELMKFIRSVVTESEERLGADFKADIADLRDELADTRKELNAGITALRSDMDQLFTGVGEALEDINEALQMDRHYVDETFGNHARSIAQLHTKFAAAS